MLGFKKETFGSTWSNYNVNTWKQKICENGKVEDGLPLHNYISASQQRSHHNNLYSQLCKMIHALITSDTSHWSISALKAEDSKTQQVEQIQALNHRAGKILPTSTIICTY